MRCADTSANCESVKQQAREVFLYYLQSSADEKLELIKEFILSRMETMELLFYLGFDFTPHAGANKVSKEIIDSLVKGFFKSIRTVVGFHKECFLALFLRALLNAIPDQALNYFPHTLTAADASTLTTAFNSKQLNEKTRLACLQIAYLCSLSDVELDYMNVKRLSQLTPSLAPFRQRKSQNLFILLRKAVATPASLKQRAVNINENAYFATAQQRERENALSEALVDYAAAARQGHADAKARLQKCAEKDNALAHYHLAVIGEYEDNWSAAFSHYRHAAQLGYQQALPALLALGLASEQMAVSAAFELGCLYDKGGILENIGKACSYYEDAVRCGHAPSAMALNQLLKRLLLTKEPYNNLLIAKFGYKLASAYQNSLDDTCENKRAALFWYLQAARKGSLVAVGCLQDMARDDAGCDFQLAQWLEDGNDFFPQDKSKACECYFAAAKRGHEEALIALERLLREMNNSTVKLHSRNSMSEDERAVLSKHLKAVAEGHDAVLDYLEEKARGDARYAFEIAQWLESRNDISSQNKSKRCDYYFMAAKKNHEEALTALVRLLKEMNNIGLNDFSLFKQKAVSLDNNNEVAEPNRMSASIC